MLDSYVLKVLDRQELSVEDKGLEWLNTEKVLYKVEAISYGHTFVTNIWLNKKDDKGQIVKGYCFQQ